MTSGRSSSRRKSEVLRPLESEKTFLLVQVKLSISRKWKLSRLCFVARASYRICVLVSVSFFSYFLLPLPPFFPILSLVRIYHDSQHRLNAIFCYFIGRCQNAGPREQFDNRDDARKIDDLRDELQADDADQSYV